MSARDAALAAALLVALAACDRGQTRAEAPRDAPPPAPDSALVARLGALENAALDSLPADPAKGVLMRACTSCHSVQLITRQRKTPEEWAKTVDKMVSWGAPLQPAERQGLVDYLARLRPIPPPSGTASRD